MPVALFGITNSGLDLFVNLVILFLVVVWIALIAWTYLDARRRISDSVLVACATGASVFPFVGTVIYTILRPPEFLEDAKERELEMRAAELRVRQLQEQSCQNCGFPIERNFLRCPNCRNRVKDPCYSCGQPIDPRWSVCPYCEAAVRPPAAPAAPAATSASGERRARPRATRPAEMPVREPGRAPRSSTSAVRKAAPAPRQSATQRKSSGERVAPAERSAPAERPAASPRATRAPRRAANPSASVKRSAEPGETRSAPRRDDSAE